MNSEGYRNVPFYYKDSHTHTKSPKIASQKGNYQFPSAEWGVRGQRSDCEFLNSLEASGKV